jgi:hypothetical protein
LNVNPSFSGQVPLSTFRGQVSAGKRSGRTARLFSLANLVLVLVCAAASLGCDTVNPNLGSTPIMTSTVTIITPSATTAGGPAFTLTVSGGTFVSGSTVQWNGSNRPTTFVNDTTLTAAISATDIASPGTISIGVVSPLPSNSQKNLGNNISNLVPFTVAAASNPVPAITQISPSVAKVGGPAFTITVTGSGFVSGSQVQWQASPRPTTFTSSTQLTAQISAADIASLGTARVTVFTPAPGGGSSNTLTFTINSTGSAVTAADPRAVNGTPPQSSAAISTGHRYVAFVGKAADVLPDSTPAATTTAIDHIFVRDTCEGAPAGCVPKTALVSGSLIGPEADGGSRSPAISADGRFVVFVSDATNLVPGDNNGVADVFMRDTCFGAAADCTPATTRISISSDSNEANGASASPSISADGRFVAFDSDATNLVLDNASAGRTFVRDTCHGAANSCTPATSRLDIPSAATN